MISGIIIGGTTINGKAVGTDRDVIIGFKKPVGPSEEAYIHSNGGVTKKSFHLIPAIAARVPENKIDEIKKDPRIAYVEDDKIFQAADEYTSSWGVQHIGSQMVHYQGITGTGVKVAVLDTGIDYNHEDLKNNYKGGIGFVVDQNGNVNTDPFDDSYNSHGTHVSGIIAAEKNGIGVVGVAPNTSIYAVKVLDGSGFGFASWIISGIQWAVDNNINIVTMSIQGSDLISLHNATDVAYSSGILLVAAGGNTYGGNVSYPAAYDSVIAVTATDATDQTASFSSIGPEIELAAPGVNIYSTIRGGYGYLSGTSMAAPHVAGVATLIFSTNFPDINNDGKRDNKDVRAILQNTAKDLGDFGKDNIYGYGLVDASNAILGISAYPEGADLSITKDDGVTTVIAGDGQTYMYTIMVKNNGPADAFSVKVSDIWPVGFVRGTVTTSQGSCDTTANPMNFTCDLGKIANNGLVKITANYSVPIGTFDGGYESYINKVEVSSTTPDYDNNNNKAVDTNTIGEVELALVRTTGPEINDAKNVSLSQGNYSVEIHNINLSKVDMKVYENGVIRKDLSSSYKFNKSDDIEFNIDIKNTLKIVFIPYGGKGSIGYVTIRKL